MDMISSTMETAKGGEKVIKVKDSAGLKRLMKVKGYSQTKLAKEISISLSYLYMVTNGQKTVGAEKATMIAKKLGKDVEELFVIE